MRLVEGVESRPQFRRRELLCRYGLYNLSAQQVRRPARSAAGLAKGDPAEPRPEPLCTAKAWKISPSDEEGLLDDVSGGLLISQRREGESV